MLIAVVNDTNDRMSYLVVIIQPDNLERMKKADPITLETSEAGGVLPPVRYPERAITIVAYEEEASEIMKLAQTDGFALIKHLMRGYNFNPNLDGKEKVIKI